MLTIERSYYAKPYHIPAVHPAQVRVLALCRNGPDAVLTGSGIELLFTGSELWVRAKCRLRQPWNPWVSVELDGVDRCFAVNPGTSRMCILAGRTGAGQAWLLQDVQAMSEDPAHLLRYRYLPCGRRFLPLPAPRSLSPTSA